MSSGTLPQLNIADFEPQIIWLFIVFSIFYTIIKTRIVPYFSFETESREGYILNNYQDAKKLQKKAERLSDEYNQKIQAVYLKANNLIIDAKQKLNRDLEAEKNRLNNEIANRFSEHSVLIEQQVERINTELSTTIDALKKQAELKIFAVPLGGGNNNIKIYNEKVIGGKS